MSVNYASLGSISALLPPDFNVNAGAGATDSEVRIKQVSKAMEMLFTSQLTAELGQDFDGASEAGGSDDPGSGSNVYGDFIHQAMTQGLTSGHGLGLAEQIEKYLTERAHPTPAPYMHPALAKPAKPAATHAFPAHPSLSPSHVHQPAS
ncbi:MAG: hypothetical protein WDO13_05825 [Verrucomicrobiota bacterium]